MTELQQMFADLDTYLTGKDERAVAHTARSNNVSAESLIAGPGDRAYYLSDGGYSRVYIHILSEELPLCLTSNSTDKVKARWKECRELRQAVENEVHRQLRELGWMG